MGQGFLNWGLDRIRAVDELVDDVVVLSEQIQLGLQSDRALYELALRGHSRDHLRHRRAAGHLQPVGPVVFKRTGIQQLIKEANRFRNADREVSNGVTAAILSIER